MTNIARQFNRGFHAHDPKLKRTLPDGNAVTEARVTSGNTVTVRDVTRDTAVTSDVVGDLNRATRHMTPRDAVTVRDVTGELDALWREVTLLRTQVMTLQLAQHVVKEQARPMMPDRPNAGRMTPAEKQAAYRARKRGATHADLAGD